MHTTEVIKLIAKDTGLTRAQVKAVLDSHTTIAQKTLKKEGSFNLLGMAKLTVRTVPRKPKRMWKNIRTGEMMELPAKPAHKAVKARVLTKAKNVLATRKKKK